MKKKYRFWRFKMRRVPDFIVNKIFASVLAFVLCVVVVIEFYNVIIQHDKTLLEYQLLLPLIFLFIIFAIMFIMIVKRKKDDD